MQQSRDYTIERSYHAASMPCQGYIGFIETDPALRRPGTSYGAVPVLDLVGRDLPEGSVIRVTVEVVKESKWPRKCQIPWHKGRRAGHGGGHWGDVIPLPKVDTAQPVR